MASGYRAYEINGQRFESLADTSHADHIVVSALLFTLGVPGPDDDPKTFAVRYDPAVILPNVRDTRLTESDLVDAFDADTRQRILVDGDPMPPEICDRLLGVLLLKTYGDHIESSTRFLLRSTVESSGSNFFERLNRAIDEGDVDLGSMTVKAFHGTHLLVDLSAGNPSVDVQTKPYVRSDARGADGRGAQENRSVKPPPSGTSSQEGPRPTQPAGQPQGERNRATPARRNSGRSDAESRLKVSGFDDPSDITTGAEVDPEAKHVPADVARDIESLRDRVDEDHDFGASYDFTPSSIDSPSDTPYRPPDDIRPGDLNDVSEEVASEVATSSLDYTFGPRRSIEEDLGISSGYRFGPARSLEEDLGAGVSKTWAETMQNVSRIEDTSASYMAPSYDFGQSAYDFDTSDLYDFTPPEYDDAGTTEKTVLTDGNDSSTVSKNASRFPPDQSSGISSGESSSSSVPTGADMSTMAGDVSAMGSRVMGIATGLTGTAKKKTNEGADLGLVFQLFLIICILTGLTYLVLSI